MIMNRFDIIYDEKSETLHLYKIPNQKFVNIEEGKYGISFYKDITDKTVRIDIPEPLILFGTNLETLESFLRD